MQADNLPDYTKTGTGSTTVFLLHGGYGSKEYWAFETAYLLKQGYRVVAWDAPGYGLSPLPENYSIELLAEAAAQLITALGTSRNIIIGHSMGGIIAPKICEIIPDKIHAVVISSSLASLSQGGEEFVRDFMEKRVPPLRKVTTLAEAALPLLKTMFAPSSSGPMYDLVLREAGKTPSATFIEAMLAIQRYDGNPVVRKLQIPALCVAGRHDPVAQWQMVKELAAMIPNAEFAVFDDAGHYPFAEVPDAFHAKLMGFLSRNNLTV